MSKAARKRLSQQITQIDRWVRELDNDSLWRTSDSPSREWRDDEILRLLYRRDELVAQLTQEN